MAIPFYQVSRDAQEALTEFSTEFDQALALADPNVWARRFGLWLTSKAIMTRFPIPVSAAGYKERKGDAKFRSLYEKTIGLKSKEWQDGVSEFSRVIEAPDFIGWAGEPARIAREGNRQPNLLVADVLEGNPTLEFDGKALFADDHPVNIFQSEFGTFDNDHTDTLAHVTDGTFFKTVLQRFGEKKGPNGRPMGLKFTTVLGPPALTQTFKDPLENDQLIITIASSFGPVNNRFKNVVEYIECPEFTATDTVYCLDGQAGCYPWVGRDGGSPDEIVFDKNSDMWKLTGKLAISYVLEMEAGAALPHGIERITLS